MMDMYEKIGEIAAGFENDMVDFARRLIQTKVSAEQRAAWQNCIRMK